MSHNFEDQIRHTKRLVDDQEIALSDLALVKLDLVGPANSGFDFGNKAFQAIRSNRAEVIKETIEEETGLDTELPPPPPPGPMAPSLPQQLGPFVKEPIHFPGSIPVKVYDNQLTLYRDGRYRFRGRFYNAGAGSYDTEIGWVIFGASGTGYSFGRAGHLEWGPDENDGWDAGDRTDALAEAYADIAKGDHVGWCQAAVNWNVVDLIGEIVKVVNPAARIVEILRMF